MIDARRDEVFTALYQLKPVIRHPSSVIDPSVIRHPSSVIDPSANRQPPTANQLIEIMPPQAMILDKNAFDSYLSGNRIIFSGSGADKLEKMINSSQAIFKSQNSIIQSFATSSQLDFDEGKWVDPVISAPVYLKEFFSY